MEFKINMKVAMENRVPSQRNLGTKFVLVNKQCAFYDISSRVFTCVFVLVSMLSVDHVSTIKVKAAKAFVPRCNVCHCGLSTKSGIQK